MTRFSSRALAGAAITVLLGSFAVVPAVAEEIVPAAPVVAWTTALVDTQSYAYGSVEVTTKPTCIVVADPTLPCPVAGWEQTVGIHKLVATVGGVEATPTITYTVTATWKLKGFFSPVKKNGTLTRHYGSNTPLKFSIKENGKTKTRAAISTFSAVPVSCTADHTPVLGGTTFDLFPTTKRTGSTFHENWKTSKIKPVKVTVPAKGKAKAKKVIVSSCFQVTMTALDGQALTALVTFKK